MKNLLLLFCFFGASLSYSQSKFLFTNSVPIDKKRYDEVKGSPMIFEDWVLGTIIDEDGAEYKDVLLNYNGHTETFEVKKSDDEFIVLDPQAYERVLITDSNAKKQLDLEFLDALLFKKSLHPKMKEKYILSVFEGKGYQLLKYFKSTIITTKKNIPGEIVEINRFSSKDIIVLFDHGEKFDFTMKKRSMKKNLPVDWKLDKWNKKNKEDVYSYEGLIAFIQDLIDDGS